MVVLWFRQALPFRAPRQAPLLPRSDASKASVDRQRSKGPSSCSSLSKRTAVSFKSRKNVLLWSGLSTKDHGTLTRMYGTRGRHRDRVPHQFACRQKDFPAGKLVRVWGGSVWKDYSCSA